MWLLCNESKVWERTRLELAALRNDLDLTIVNPDKLVIFKGALETKFYLEGKELPAPLRILNWMGCSSQDNIIQIMYSLPDVKFINPPEEINLLTNKLTFQLSTNLNVVDTLKISSDEIVSHIPVIEAKFTYPFVLKGNIGSLGKGVYKVTNRDNLKQIAEVISLLDKRYQFHIEQFVDYQADVRMLIVGDEYWLMNRVNADDFRANVALGANPTIIATNQQFDAIFKLVKTNYKSPIFGVDLLVCNDQIYICEINISPNFKGIQTLTNVDIARKIILLAKKM